MNVKGEKRLFEAIDKLADLISDQRKRGWQKNVDVRLDFERKWLDSEGNGEWPELGAEYERDKEAAVGNLPIEQYSKQMYRSLTEEGAQNFVREETADSLKVGTSDPKARWQHEGAGHLPVREMMKKTEEEAQAHLLVFHDSYAAATQALGFKVI